MLKYFTRLCFCFACPVLLCAEHFDYSQLQPLEQDSKNLTSYEYPYIYEPTSRLGYLSIGSGLILGGTLVGAGVLYLMPESVTNWDRNEVAKLGNNWAKKTARGPVVDGDDWFLNWITHPYWGAVYYMQPRVAGYSWAESALYSTLASALFWEYGIEAFAETPSWQDLVITPAVGSILGELFYQASMKIHKNQNTLLGSRFLGKSALLLMDPVGFILQDLGLARGFGVKNKNDMQSFITPTSGKSGSGARLVVVKHF